MQMMSWFRKALEKEPAKTGGVLSPQKPNLKWQMRAGDFLEDDLKAYLNPHMGAILLDMMDIVPEKFHDKVFIAGGFAAYVAGITKEHGDIDIFCDTASTFDNLVQIFHKHAHTGLITRTADIVSTEKYGRLVKYETKDDKYQRGLKFDLVDVTPVAAGHGPLNILLILMTFDISWAMAGFTLADPQKLWIHSEALSEYIRVNLDRVKHLEGTQSRIEKYSKRLTKNADLPYAVNVIEAIGVHLRDEDRNVHSGS